MVVDLHSASALVSINKVNVGRARLVLGWVTMARLNSQFGTFISVFNQSPRPTQPGHPFVTKTYSWGVKACTWVAGKTV